MRRQAARRSGFKSHHSGMETPTGGGTGIIDGDFKSHHSGMETGASLYHLFTGFIALNRTIVGWKPIFVPASVTLSPTLNRTIVGWKRPHSRTRWGRAAPLNRTIVGWKQSSASCSRFRCISFKSHHSGMETLLRPKELREFQHFKSHHSGMETTLRIRFDQYLQFFKSHHSGMET